MSSFFAISSILLSGIAAVLGIRAATIDVRNNIDEFIGDLHRQGRWASYAAIAAACATALQAVQQFSQ
jgi:hypothetical protein